MMLLNIIRLKNLTYNWMHEKVNTILTATIGAASVQATDIAIDAISSADIAALTQTIVNVLIGIITIYKLLKKNKAK